jgi:hypothetical protein
MEDAQLASERREAGRISEKQLPVFGKILLNLKSPCSIRWRASEFLDRRAGGSPPQP